MHIRAPHLVEARLGDVSQFLTFLACSTALCAALGCGMAESDGHTGSRGQVRGTVTFQGKPVPEGSRVLFIGTQGGYTATGEVGEGGTYRLSYRVGAGMPIGEYAVQVAPPVENGSTPSDDPAEMAQRMTLSPKQDVGEKGPFPNRYAATSTSGLTFTVVAGDNVANFDLLP